LLPERFAADHRACLGCWPDAYGLGPGLVDEDQPSRIDPPAVFTPLHATADDIGADPLSGDQRFFCG